MSSASRRASYDAGGSCKRKDSATPNSAVAGEEERVPVKPSDVVAGRGRYIFHSPGNERYEKLLDRYAVQHVRAGGSMTTAEAQNAIASLLSGCRMMSKYCKHTKTACVMTSQARDAKIGQAIRYRNSQRKKGRKARRTFSKNSPEALHPASSSISRSLPQDLSSCMLERPPRKIKLHHGQEPFGNRPAKIPLACYNVHEFVDIGSTVQHSSPEEEPTFDLGSSSHFPKRASSLLLRQRLFVAEGNSEQDEALSSGAGSSCFSSWRMGIDLPPSMCRRSSSTQQQSERQTVFPDLTLAQHHVRSHLPFSQRSLSWRNQRALPEGTGGTTPRSGCCEAEWSVLGSSSVVGDLEPIPFQQAMVVNNSTEETSDEGSVVRIFARV